MSDHHHNAHYKALAIDALNIASTANFVTGNIIKYIARHELKGEKIKDLQKAKFYLEMLANDKSMYKCSANIYQWQAFENQFKNKYSATYELLNAFRTKVKTNFVNYYTPKAKPGESEIQKEQLTPDSFMGIFMKYVENVSQPQTSSAKKEVKKLQDKASLFVIEQRKKQAKNLQVVPEVVTSGGGYAEAANN